MKHTIEFDEEDAPELFFMIRSRGYSMTRVKLLSALRRINAHLAGRIDEYEAKNGIKPVRYTEASAP